MAFWGTGTQMKGQIHYKMLQYSFLSQVLVPVCYSLLLLRSLRWPWILFSFYRMALKDHGIITTEDKGKNDTNISTVNHFTEDYNYTTQSPNQTAFMGNHQSQGQTIWIPITIAVVVILVIVLVIIVAKKKKWFRGKIMGLIGVFTYLHINMYVYILEF